MRYTLGQMQDIARQAGWPEDLLVTIAAIGMGESGGDPNAQNPNLARENSIGLWQVNRYAWPQYSAADLHDPIYNAKAAFAIYQRQGFRAWGAYTNGSFRKFLSASQAAYDGYDSGSSASSLIHFGSQPLELLNSSSPLTLVVWGLVGILVLDWIVD